MTQYIHPLALDAAANFIVDNAVELRLVRAYSLSDTHVDVVRNTICTVGISAEDFELSSSASGRRLRLLQQSGISMGASTGSAGGNNHHWVICSASDVLKVFDEISNVPIDAGSIVHSPILDTTFDQPVVL